VAPGTEQWENSDGFSIDFATRFSIYYIYS
jgi:hypothetical protein